jgi:hypothetical protein
VTNEPDKEPPAGPRGSLTVADFTSLFEFAMSMNTQDTTTQLKQLSAQYAKFFADPAQVATSKSDLLKIELPPLRVGDYQSLSLNLEKLSQQILTQLAPTFAAVHDMQREQFAHVFVNLVKLPEALWPPNWRGAGEPAEDLLGRMLLDEGLALAWVPPSDILGRLFVADTGQQRRRIIGSNWKRIIEAARTELDQVTAPRLKEHIHFARRAADAVLAGNHPEGQALAANLLDTIMRREFSSTDRYTITDQKNRIDVEDYPVRWALVLGGIWGAFGEYWPNKGQKIPWRFSRHASAHGVSNRQYSRINATISLMHLTALLRVIQQDMLT